MLDDKGVRTLLAAFKIMRAANRDCRLLLAGSPDPANPASIPQNEWPPGAANPASPGSAQVDDIATLWQRAHIAVLPSRREGLPKSLLEAAACGRPLIATDVPGCREIVIAREDRPAGAGRRSGGARRRHGAARAFVAAAHPPRRRGAATGRRTLRADLIGKATVDLYRACIDS